LFLNVFKFKNIEVEGELWCEWWCNCKTKTNYPRLTWEMPTMIYNSIQNQGCVVCTNHQKMEKFVVLTINCVLCVQWCSWHSWSDVCLKNIEANEKDLFLTVFFHLIFPQINFWHIGQDSWPKIICWLFINFIGRDYKWELFLLYFLQCL